MKLAPSWDDARPPIPSVQQPFKLKLTSAEERFRRRRRGRRVVREIVNFIKPKGEQ